MRGNGGGGVSSRYLVVTGAAVFFSAIMSGMISSHLTKSYVSNKLMQHQSGGVGIAGTGGSAAADELLTLCKSALEKGSSAGSAVAAPSCPPQQPCPKCEAGASMSGGDPAAALAASSAPPDVPLIEIPEGIQNVIINIGTNFNPIMPPEDDPTTMVIAVEPILETANKIKKHNRLFVILTAIASGEARFQTMQVHNVGGASSSLAAPTNKKAFWVGTKKDGWPDRQIVPVMSMATLLASIPRTVNITHLKTDMQGFDFAAVKSAGRQLRRVPSLYTEVYHGTASYEGVNNDLEKDWDPYMKTIGFKRTSTNTKKRGEDNAEWVREGEMDV